MKFTIDDEVIKKHFSEGQIKGFMRELDLNYMETFFYLWFYNYVSICPKDLKTDNGRPMYIQFAKGIGKVLKEDKISELEQRNAELTNVIFLMMNALNEKNNTLQEFNSLDFEGIRKENEILERKISGQRTLLDSYRKTSSEKNARLEEAERKLKQIERITNDFCNSNVYLEIDALADLVDDILQTIQEENKTNNNKTSNTYGFRIGKHIIDIESFDEQEAFNILSKEYWQYITDAEEIILLGKLQNEGEQQ